MTNLLIKTFIKDSENIHNSQVRERYGMLSSSVGMVCNIFLFLLKLILGLVSGSIAITADAFNNLSDVGSSAVTFLGFKLAAAPADDDHPFGHGRMEYLSGMVIAVLVLLVGWEVVTTSVDKILHPTELLFSPWVVAALVLSICVKLWMGYFYHTLGKKINSGTMKASAADSLSDCFSTGATTLGILLSPLLPFPVDGWLGLLVGGLILYAGAGIAKDTVDPLLGNAPDPELVKEVNQILLSYPIIAGVHDLVIHDYGPGRVMGSAHVEIPAHYDLLEAHDQIDNAEKEINTRLHMPFVLHMDPVVTSCEETNFLKEQVVHIVAQIHPQMTIHDFRMVKGPTHSNLIFDVVVPHDYKEKNMVLKQRIDKEISKIDPRYFTAITFDHSYIS